MDALSHIRFADATAMTEVLDGSAALTILSPPYVGHHTQHEKDAEAELLSRLFAECARVTAEDGVIVSFNTDLRDRGKMYLRNLVVVEAALVSGLEVFDEKMRIRHFGQDPYRKSFSFIFFFRHRGKRLRQNRRIHEYECDNWYLPRRQVIGDFRDALPPEVPVLAIQNFTRPGDLVVSSCAGTGTVVIAALKMERRAIGYEINPNMAPLVLEREKRFFEFFSSPSVARFVEAPY